MTCILDSLLPYFKHWVHDLQESQPSSAGLPAVRDREMLLRPSVHHNHLEGLFTRGAGPTPWFGASRPGSGPVMCSPGDAAGPGTTH